MEEETEEKLKGSFYVEWKGGFDTVTLSMGGKVISEVKETQ